MTTFEGLHRLVLPAIASLLALGPAAAGAQGQTAYLVTDLSPGEGGREGSSAFAALAAGNRLFFLANPALSAQPSHTEELWVTAGTAAGAEQLPDPCTSAFCDSSSQLVATLGGLAFINEQPGFFASLWRTDGTRAGTFPLSTTGTAASFATLGGRLYFLSFSENGPVPEQLWRTDGTAVGTSAVADLQVPQGVLPDATLLAAGGKLFFLQPEPAPNSIFPNLWASDGTTEGTALIGRFHRTNLGALTVAGDRLFFVADLPPNFSTNELWVSDGTASGTKLATPQTFASLNWLKALGNRIYFEADDGTHGLQIWVSDGSAAGTRQLTSVPSSFGLPGANGVAEAGSKLVLVGSTLPGVGSLWAVAPGSPGSVANLCPRRCGSIGADTALVATGGRVLFPTTSTEASFEESLWSTDGTPRGTALLKSCSGICQASRLLAGAAYFVVTESDGMPRLWRTDGTPGGTVRVAPTPLDPFSPLLLASLPGKVFFDAPDLLGSSPFADELFVSDGTVAGTHQLTDTTDPLSSSPAGLVAAGGEVFFTASSSADPATFWRSAGTAASTLPTAVSPAPGTPPPVAAFGGLVYLQYSDASLQLWRSDGTAAGTLPLTSFSVPQAAAPAAPVICGTGVCFGVVTVGGGGAVWPGSATPQGTGQLFTLPATVRGIERLAVLGNDYYLELDNAAGGIDFWQSDGTTGGTVQLTDFQSLRVNPGFDPGFVRRGNLVYFIVGEPGALWHTDGTRVC